MTLRTEYLTVCDNCGERRFSDRLRHPSGLALRVDEDGPQPAGECPSCGSLAYTTHEIEFYERGGRHLARVMEPRPDSIYGARVLFQTRDVRGLAFAREAAVRAILRKGRFTLIHSHGSTWAGQLYEPLGALDRMLATAPLDPTFEATGRFSFPHHAEKGVWRFFGNFHGVSHGFNIETTETDLIERISGAIRENMRRPDYRQARKDAAPSIAQTIQTIRRRRAHERKRAA